MTVYIEKPAVNLREELASLRNQGGYQEQQFYFDGLVTNGTFDTDTNWTKGTGWTISGGTANADGITNGDSLLQVITGLTIGQVYRLDFDLSNRTTGYLIGIIRDAGDTTTIAQTANLTANGSYSLTFTATATSHAVRSISYISDFSIDNVSVFETDGTDVIHTMPKGWVPKDVFEDGLLQREGAANDYEVVYDGFDYAVKPTVAPSATTQTCVIGVRK